jgi:V/A-type H+/Na+-transporting ATPase subunit I
LLYPARMKKVTILTHADFISPLTRDLHRSGVMQIDPIEVDGLESCSPDRSSIESLSSRIDNIFEAIQFEEEEDAMEMLLDPKPPEVFDIPERSLEELLSFSTTVLEPVDSAISHLDSRLLKLRDLSHRLEEQQAELLPLKGLDMDISHLGPGEEVSVIAGSTRDLDGLLAMLKSELIHVYHEGTKGEFSVVIFAHNEELRLVEKARRQRCFDAIDLNSLIQVIPENPDTEGLSTEIASSPPTSTPPSSSSPSSSSSLSIPSPSTPPHPSQGYQLKGKPIDILREIDTDLLSIRGEVREIEEEFTALYREHRKDLLILREEVSIQLEKTRVFDKFAGTRTAIALTGWVEADRDSDLNDLCDKATDGHCVVSFEEPEGNEPPVQLRNDAWARPFEPLVHMFSTPKYNELDTSMVVGPLFIIFFGLMLGDAGYGLVIIAMALFALKVHGPVSEEIRDAGYFMLLMGISTVIFGLIMGGFFYDAIPRFIYGDETQLLYPQISVLFFTFPMDPMNDPTTIFLASLIIGLLTLNFGVVLGAYHHYKIKDYHSLVTGDLSWFILEPGGILLIGYSMFGAFSLGSTTIMMCVVTALFGLVLRVIHSKGLVMFDFTGFVGNVLSFARILALALATAGLALAINYFSQLIGEIHIILIIVGLGLFIVAHFINTLLQALGAGIHSLRLNYVEFFSMFYEGGGKAFDAFHIERTYTQVVEKEANQ